MKRNIFYYSFILCTMFLFSACVKDGLNDGGGHTLIKIKGGGDSPVVIAMDLDPQFEDLQILDLRRDAVNNADLNVPATITITNTQAFLDDYNDANGTAFELLPTDSYTITAGSGVAVSGDTWTINLASGEFAREVSITLDKSKLDLAKSYAFGLQITQTTVGTPSLESGFAIINPLVKNQYDGKYTVSAVSPMVDFSNADLTGNYPWDVELRTTGPNSVMVFDVENDYPLHPILSAGAWSYYGSFGMEFTFNPATGAVTSVTNPFGQPSSNGRSAELNPAGTNMWDAGTGDINVTYWMNQPSVITPHRVAFDELFEYTGPR